ncbi:MAG: DNA repair protein RecN [Prevotella sp.]|nr:DNA repair protein RecN [Prevotella sp.]
MLTHLYIKNFTLIDELDIDFHSGFSVITGETGAGKSIVLGAIGLLLGNRADIKQIKKGQERCIVEAHFDLSRYHLQSFFTDNDIDFDAADCIVRREVNSNGKSRAFINDTPVSLTQMKELGTQLIDIHSQHQNLLLNQEDFQLSVCDIIANSHSALESYGSSFKELVEKRKSFQSLQETIQRSKDNEEFTRFQYKELEEASLVEGEQSELEQRSEMMSHSEEIKSGLYDADMILSNVPNVVEHLKTAVSKLQSIEKIYPASVELAERMESCYIELRDLQQEISHQVYNIDFDPAELDQINQRLDLLNTLQHKHRVESVEELIGIREQLAEQLSHIENSDEELHELEQQIGKLEEVCLQKAQKLTVLRKKAAKQIEKEMQSRLVPMGIPHVRFQVEFTPKELSHDGADKVSFLFSANSSSPLQPVSQVASGGEIARVMLSLKAMISGAVKLPTIVFDEIDTGVSGKVAEKMAQIMQEMGNNDRQVISITHLPQIAALGKIHYKVTKEETKQGTSTRMTQLTTEERVKEVAQMLSGSSITAAAIDNAKVLLNI